MQAAGSAGQLPGHGRLMVGIRRRTPATGPGAEAGREPDRLAAFNDAVMAVIITIMAFQLQAPTAPSLHALGSRLPALLVYVLSFTVIGIYWVNHHHLLPPPSGSTAR